MRGGETCRYRQFHLVIFREPYRLRYQFPVDFLDQLVHRIAEELVHCAEAALGVEGGEVEVVALEAEGCHDVVADELVEGCLGFVEGLAGVLFEDPVAVVAADGGVEGREGLIRVRRRGG